MLKELKKSDGNADGGTPGGGVEKQPDRDVEEGGAQGQLRKRKISQNLSSHGSFFLRVGAIGNWLALHCPYTVAVYLPVIGRGLRYLNK